MKTIIIGYRDAGALDSGEIISKFGASEMDNAQIMLDARQQHKFPEGFKRVRQMAVDDDHPLNDFGFISDDVAAFSQASHKKQQELVAQGRKAAVLERDREKNIAAANKLVSNAAIARNHAIGKLSAAREQISGGRLKDSDKAKLIEKVAKLEGEAKDLASAFDATLAAANIVRNQKSTPDQLEKALIDLKLKTIPA